MYNWILDTGYNQDNLDILNNIILRLKSQFNKYNITINNVYSLNKNFAISTKIKKINTETINSALCSIQNSETKENVIWVCNNYLTFATILKREIENEFPELFPVIRIVNSKSKLGKFKLLSKINIPAVIYDLDINSYTPAKLNRLSLSIIRFMLLINLYGKTKCGL